MVLCAAFTVFSGMGLCSNAANSAADRNAFRAFTSAISALPFTPPPTPTSSAR